MKKIEEFINRNKERTIRYLSSRYSGLSRQDVEDVFQDSTIALVEKDRDGILRTIQSSLYAYFIGICSHKAMRIVEKRKHVFSIDINDVPSKNSTISSEKIQDIIELTESGLSQDEICTIDEIVDMVMNELSPKCQNLFMGYYWENLSTQAIATMYGYANANVVKSEKYRCLGLFRQKYNDLKTKFYGN